MPISCSEFFTLSSLDTWMMASTLVIAIRINPTPKSPKLESSLSVSVLVLPQDRGLEFHRTGRPGHRFVIQTRRCPSRRNNIFRIRGNAVFMQIQAVKLALARHSQGTRRIDQ